MINMTKGRIPGQLIRYSIPLILGNMFQLTYNAVDSVIVGRAAGEEALAAVGTANPVMNILILGISGICIGASVLMSQFFGAGDHHRLKKEFSTTLLLGMGMSVILAALGILLSGQIMRWLHVPVEILDRGSLYLRIIFAGVPFTFLYNVMASGFRSVGDSKTPVYFLAIASVLNAGLDILFVVVLHMDVAGAAAATVIAEGISAVLCVGYIYKKIPTLALKRTELILDKELVKMTLKHGSMTALQQSCLPIGKLLVQGMVNPLGVSAIAAFNAVNRVDDFAFTPEQSISHGMMTFVAQNRGANNKERVRQGFKAGLMVETGYWVCICLAVFLFREPIMKLFVTEGEDAVVSIGTKYLGVMAFLYLMPAFTNGIQGFFRGMGNMSVTLFSTFIQIAARVIGVYVLIGRYGIPGTAYACMAGWTVMLLFQIPYCIRFIKKSSFFKE